MLAVLRNMICRRRSQPNLDTVLSEALDEKGACVQRLTVGLHCCGA